MEPAGTNAWMRGSRTEVQRVGVSPHHHDHSSPRCDQSQSLLQIARLWSTSAMAQGARNLPVRASAASNMPALTVGDDTLESRPPANDAHALRVSDERVAQVRTARPWHRYAHHIRELPAQLEKLAADLRVPPG